MNQVGPDVLGRLQIVRDYLAAFQMATGVKLRVAEPSEKCANALPGSECFLQGLSCLREPVVIAGNHVATLTSECFIVKDDLRSVAGGGNGERHVVLNEPQFRGFMHLLSVFAQHISVFANRYLIAAQRQDPPWLARAKELVQGKFADPVSASDVARQVKLGTPLFIRKFKGATGMSFRDYVARVRVEQAAKLLGQSPASFTELAFTCGFQSLACLNRAFKRFMGVTPAEYRASLRVGRLSEVTHPSDAPVRSMPVRPSGSPAAMGRPTVI